MQRTLTLSLRPRSFTEMIGNADAVNAVKNLLESGKIPVAFEFVGPFGTGKTTLARIVAREIQGFDFPADMEPDVDEVNASDSTGVDDMRRLADRAQYAPLVGRYRVHILDEAHKLSSSAQNMLLKEFEKDDSPTVWIVCTTESKKLLKGLQDRAFKLELKPMTPEDRLALIRRAAGMRDPEWVQVFVDEAAKAGLDSPRDILMSFERYLAGVPAKDAVAVEKTDPEYFKVAFAACYGGWPECAKLLHELKERLTKEKKAEKDKDAKDDDADDKGETKAAAAQAILGITASMLMGLLLGNPVKNKPAAAGPRAKAVVEAISALSDCVPPQHAPALAFPALSAALCKVCALLKSGAA